MVLPSEAFCEVVGMMWLCGFVAGAAFSGAIAVAALWHDVKNSETKHQKYVREWQRANAAWIRHPRAVRHKKDLAPLPLDLRWPE